MGSKTNDQGRYYVHDEIEKDTPLSCSLPFSSSKRICSSNPVDCHIEPLKKKKKKKKKQQQQEKKEQTMMIGDVDEEGGDCRRYHANVS